MKVYKPIQGYEGLYEISSDGEVIAVRFNKRKTMKPGMWTNGYLFVNLKKDGRQRSWSIHRLLALHFLPNPEGKPQVNHKDGNKLNNRLDNLEWSTQAENIQHMYETGLKTYKPLHYKGKFGAEHNRSKCIRCSNGKTYGSISEAARELGLDHSTISLAIKESRPLRNGLYFEIAS